MVDQDGLRSEIITQLLRHVTSSSYDADLKGEIFRRTVYHPSLVVIAFIFGVTRDSPPAHPGRRRLKKKPGLNRVKIG